MQARLGAVFQLVAFLTTALLLPAAWGSTAVANPIGRFYQVAPGIYRGERPEAEGIKFLAAHGFKTVLNLENDRDEVESEFGVARSVGLGFISTPMSGFWTPKDQVVNAALGALNDSGNYPIFVHCKHGQDRTGLIVGLYRVETQKWAPGQAYDEMIDIGFHPQLYLLDRYFENRTGY